MAAKKLSKLVEVRIYVDRVALLERDPEELRKELGEGVYRTALRKLEPATPEEQGFKASDLE